MQLCAACWPELSSLSNRLDEVSMSHLDWGAQSTCREGVCCHLDTDSAACRQSNGLIPIRKITLTVLQKQSMPLVMYALGLQCCLQLFFGAGSAEEKIGGTVRPCCCTVPNHHVLDFPRHHNLQQQQQSRACWVLPFSALAHRTESICQEMHTQYRGGKRVRQHFSSC